jgi:DNA repair protein RecN (Recombination protein N)
MLRTLSIRDVVLIGRLELDFRSGLCVLTGETGAGKSILLDALGLAMGVRADARLVRHGAEQASVTAELTVAADHPVRQILRDQAIDDADQVLLLRRVLGNDGRSRAFVNDQPVSVSLLRDIGEALVEVHGQFENQRLLNPAMHRDLLDAHGNLASYVERTATAHQAWKRIAEERASAEQAMESALRDEDYLRHAVDELAALDPVAGEEEELAARRSLMMHGEKLLSAMNDAAGELNQGRGAEGILRATMRHLERVAEKAEGRLDDVIEALERAATEAAEGSALLEKASTAIDLDANALERVEERLFALRALARKHDTTVEGLPALRRELDARLAAVEDGGANVERLRRDEAAARAAYVETAATLTRVRAQAATRLDGAMVGELEPLRLGGAVFSTLVAPLSEGDWGERGCDRVAFQVSTNPGSPPGPLNRIASGGELARFMLALKAVLAEADPVPTIVFDEVDNGVGGAVAAAVGERLAKLAEDVQVLVVTHSPQVAARGAHHWLVAKSQAGPDVLTDVQFLSPERRKEEIARMLAGETITAEARAAADSLLRTPA